MESHLVPFSDVVLRPPKLKAGDRVRFVSPASTPDRDAVMRAAAVLEGWGLIVDFGPHAFHKLGYLAGTDDERLSDLNDAFRDPQVRAVFATRGGKGSYRIADGIDFEAVRRDPKPLVGFSDITILHLALWKHCRLVCIAGGLMGDSLGGPPGETNSALLKRLLMNDDDIVLDARPEEATSALTTHGMARGRLIGGNLELVATAAGWALPDLRGAILVLEAISLHRGQVDRNLTMLRKAGHLDGLAGVAVGQFTGFDLKLRPNVIDILRDHLRWLDVPILGGLPVGHGERAMSIPHGAMAALDTSARTLTIFGRESEAGS
ncbi:LD-carboxypeptidase [Rhizobium sp. LjRoot30]|uniref:S66 peptidase family protein n=1 Tax=Rhizobium sp. LjRoot30 TaxID=3342320 RepID=UPI003ECE6A59